MTIPRFFWEPNMSPYCGWAKSCTKRMVFRPYEYWDVYHQPVQDFSGMHPDKSLHSASCLLHGQNHLGHPIIEGSLEAKLPTIWTDEKQSRKEAERRERLEERRSEKRKSQKKEDADARKGRNVVKHWKSRFPVFFQWFVAPEGGKVGSLKRRVRRQLARWEMRKCTPLWREAHFQVKMYKTHQVRTTFGSCDVEKVHVVVARSTFPSQNVQNIPGPDHFWKLRCRKSARRCGAKHISKSKCTKHHMVGPLLEVAMSKKCTPLWREAHFQVKMYKTPRVRTTFGGSDVDFRKSARRCGAKHISKSKCTKHTMFGPLLEAQMSTFEKVHAVVARSTFRSQKCKKLRVLSLFWREDVEQVDTD